MSFGVYKCQECGKRPSTQSHHGLFEQHKKRGKYEAWRNHEYNIFRTCEVCHGTAGGTTKVVSGWKWRAKFFMQQYERYGEKFLEWIENVPIKENPYKELIKQCRK